MGGSRAEFCPHLAAEIKVWVWEIRAALFQTDISGIPGPIHIWAGFDQMLLRIPAQSIHTADYGWYRGRYHFSYAEYDDPENMNFGVLRALNEFVLQPGSGFDTHPHAEMEIITFCVQGELTHGDNLGYNNTLQGGDVQYLCAGSGITHSEMNEAEDRALRFYQIWITPHEEGLKPKYDCKHFSRLSNLNKLQHVVSGDDREGVIRIEQDANIYAARLGNSENIIYTNWADRQSYLVCMDGQLTINEIKLFQHDALKIWGEEAINLNAQEDSHFLLVEMASEH
jgi:redox-sensitive bicupin YhaK (pirin superfamily)